MSPEDVEQWLQTHPEFGLYTDYVAFLEDRLAQRERNAWPAVVHVQAGLVAGAVGPDVDGRRRGVTARGARDRNVVRNAAGIPRGTRG